jgi:hypothetical protein
VAFADAPRIPGGYVSETNLYGTSAQDLMESVPALAWPESIRTYHAMRFDPQIAGVLSAYQLPLLSADWVLNPKGVPDEVAELCAGALGLPILGDNDGPGPFVRRGVQWHDHLRLALLMLIYGHMPFAYAGDIVGTPPRYRLTTLSERMPATITRLDVNDDGTLKSITQFGEKTDIKAEQLVWYAHQREGANWAGTSMLRAAYPAWLIKHEMWRVLATSSRRFGMGVPTVEAPPGATPAQVTEAARLAASMRVGDQAGIGLPAGFAAKLVGLTGGTPDTLGLVRYLDQQIAQSVLASVLNLDASPNGSRALGETLVGLLKMSWQATAREVIYPANLLLSRLVDWNFGEDIPVPSILCQNLNRPEATAESLKALMDAGAVTYDPTLENAAREQYQLPPRDEDYEPPAPPMPPAPPAGLDAAPTTAPPGQTGRQPAPAAEPAGV